MSASGPSDRRFEWLVLIAYVLLVGFVAAHHEPWRDEADPWLYVRDLDLRTIVARTNYAGFPALWFLLLAPLPRLGLPYASQQALNLCIAAAAVSLFLWRAPFPRWTRGLFTFSYFMAYEYSVIVRSYALSVLLIFWVAATWRRRFEAPFWFALPMCLLFNASAHSFLLAGIFLGMWTLELILRRERPGNRIVCAFALMALAAMAAFVQLRRPPDAAVAAFRSHLSFEILPKALGGAFLPLVDPTLSIVPVLVLVALASMALGRSRSGLILLWGGMAALSFVFVAIYPGSLRHHGFYLVVLLAAFWVAAPDDAREAKGLETGWPRRATFVLLNLMLAASALAAIRMWYLDVRYAFSGGEEMGRYIREERLDRYPIAAHFPIYTQAVLPYLKDHTRFWYPGTGEWGSFMTWDLAYERGLTVPFPDAVRRTTEQFGSRPYLLLLSAEMPAPAEQGYRLLYATHGKAFRDRNERFWLYAPVASAMPPP
ncbi:MAG: hypothetical protein ABI718_07290 [Acidobacteriota bacterium]